VKKANTQEKKKENPDLIDRSGPQTAYYAEDRSWSEEKRNDWRFLNGFVESPQRPRTQQSHGAGKSVPPNDREGTEKVETSRKGGRSGCVPHGCAARDEGEKLLLGLCSNRKGLGKRPLVQRKRERRPSEKTGIFQNARRVEKSGNVEN